MLPAKTLVQEFADGLAEQQCSAPLEPRGGLFLCHLQERPSGFQRRTISIGLYRLGDKVYVESLCAFPVAGSLGRLRGSVKAPEAAWLLFQACDKRRYCFLRLVALQQHLSEQLAPGHDGSRTTGSLSMASSRSAAVRNICRASSRFPWVWAIQAVTIWRWTSIWVSGPDTAIGYKQGVRITLPRVHHRTFTEIA